MEEEVWDTVRLRDDLAEEGLSVPACTTLDGEGDDFYFDEQDLEGAVCLHDLEEEQVEEGEIESSYNSRIRLKDGCIVYMMSIDLDWGEQDGL